jgi:hypothetical protein
MLKIMTTKNVFTNQMMKVQFSMHPTNGIELDVTTHLTLTLVDSRHA